MIFPKDLSIFCLKQYTEVGSTAVQNYRATVTRTFLVPFSVPSLLLQHLKRDTLYFCEERN